MTSKMLRGFAGGALAVTVTTSVLAPSALAATGVPYEVDAYGVSGAQGGVLTLDHPAFTPFTARAGGTLKEVELQLADTSVDAEIDVTVTYEMDDFPGEGSAFPGPTLAHKVVPVGGLSSVVVDLSSVNRELGAGYDYTILVDATAGSASIRMRDGIHFQWDPALGFYSLAGGAIDASVTVSGVDDDAPSVSIEAGPESVQGLRGWFIESPLVTYACHDLSSGVVDCPAAELISEDGRFAREATVTDAVGHTSSTVQRTIKVDTTDPVVTLTADRAPNRYGWYREPVRVTTSATDATSGVAAVSAPRTYQHTRHATGGASDVAGNLRTRTLLLQIDKQAPALRILGVQRGETYSSMPNLRTRASDGTCASCSGVRDTYVEAVQLTQHKYLAVGSASDYAGNETIDQVTFYIR